MLFPTTADTEVYCAKAVGHSGFFLSMPILSFAPGIGAPANTKVYHKTGGAANLLLFM
jgi:hypothetical protein